MKHPDYAQNPTLPLKACNGLFSTVDGVGDNRPVNLSHRVAHIVLGSLSCFALAQTSPTETDLCRLVAHPKQLHNKVVRVTARVESAVIEGGTWLESASCDSSGVELVVPAYIREHPEEHPDFKALDDAIRRQGNIGTVDKEIRATFTGVFTARSGRPRLSLTLEKVENLSVQVGRLQHK